MPLHRAISCLLVSSFACCAVASLCAGQSSAPKEARAPQGAKTLSSVNIEEGHNVVFQELAPGMFSVTENAKIFQTPLLGHTAFRKSMAEMYRMVQPKSRVPESLLEADDRLVALRAKPAPAYVPPPPQVPGAGRGPKLYNGGEQAWFKQTFCHDEYGALSLLECIQGWDWITSGWQQGGIFATETMVGSEGVPANLELHWWNGSGDVLLAANKVDPGTYRWHYLTYYQPFSIYLNLSGAGGDTQVSQDMKTCGNGGQWSCSLNCGGTISCNPQNSPYCSIVGGNGESWCNKN